MHAWTLRRVAIAGLVAALIGVVVPGFHHIRCTTTVSGTVADGTETGELGCQETFPQEVAIAAALLGILAALVTLYAGVRLARAGDTAGPRCLVALSAISLLVPASIILAGWASAGFDLALADEEGTCYGGGWGDTPFWLQTSTCVDVFDVVRVPMLALAGLGAAVGARALDGRALLLGVAAGSVAVLSVVLAIVLRSTQVGMVWTLPLLGTSLLAAGAWLARRQGQGQPETAPA